MKTKNETRSQKFEVSRHLTPGATKKNQCAVPHPPSGQPKLGQPILPMGVEGGPSGRAPSEAGQARRAEWWDALPAGEKYVLRMVVDFLRKAKADPSMAAAAAKWEPSLICFIKFRLIAQAARGQVRSRTAGKVPVPIGWQLF